MEFADYIALAAQIVEGTGVLVILLGAPVALLLAFRRREGSGFFTAYRQHFGAAILLGLEFLVAADIIRTVSEDPTLSGVAVLAGIVLVRTFLSFTLQVEMDGRWPWEKVRAEE